MSSETATVDTPSAHADLTHPATADLELAAVLAALAEPARLALLRTIEREGELACVVAADLSGMAGTKSTRSHHFKVLREAGIVHMRYAGSRKLVTIRRADLNTRWPGLLDAVLIEE